MSAPPVAVIVVAAGESSRFGGDKLAARLGAHTVLDEALRAMRRALPEAPMAVVVRPSEAEAASARLAPEGIRVAAGGLRRQDSVRAGFTVLDPADETVVVIHDGARPFVPVVDTLAVVAAAREGGAAVLVAPVVDTLKRLGRHAEIEATIPREGLHRALTPQAFRAGALRRAWHVAPLDEWTDEAALVEACGDPVRGVAGDPRNVKVTNPADLDALRPLFTAGPRVGQGVDVHRFAAGRRLVLAGVEIPSEVGLLGHSDADVVLHAVADAILGGCGGGDIGEHFPPSDERWRDAPSAIFVAQALTLAAERGLRPAQCDVTLLTERPRLAPHRLAMRSSLAALLGLDADDVNIKATTCEGLGFVGRGEGLMAMAIVTLAAM